MDTVDTSQQVSTPGNPKNPKNPLGLSPVPQVEGAEALILAEQSESPSVSPTRAAVRRFFRDRRAVFCGVLVLLMIVVSYIFPLFYQHMGPMVLGGASGQRLVGPEVYHNPTQIDPVRSDSLATLFPLGPKSIIHPLGADSNGHDIFAQLMAGINTSINIAMLVEIIDITLGVLLGTLAGWYGGWLGTALDRFTDIMFAFPGLLLIILMGATLGPSFDKAFHYGAYSRVFLLVFALGVLAWPLMMRYVRGQTLQLKEQQFIEAARTVGSSDARIMLRHIVPNVINIVIVAATLDILGTIVGEAGVSLIGVGIQAPATSLGLMISNATNTLYPGSKIWPEMFWPAFTLVVLVICFSFVGDGVSNAFNPRTKD